MKKTYFAPVAKTIDLATESPLLADSIGLKNGAGLGDEYNAADVSYSNRRRIIWDDEL